MVNVENVTKVLELLKAMPNSKFQMDTWLDRPDEDQFDENGEQKPDQIFEPDQVIHNCGTVGCIGGWASVIMRQEKGVKLRWLGFSKYFAPNVSDDDPVEFHEENVAEWLGISVWTAHRLFYAEGGPRMMNEVKKDHAIKVLEHLIKTGEVRWGEEVTGDVYDWAD